MKNLEKFKDFEISKEKTKQINGGGVPGDEWQFKYHMCSSAIKWLNDNPTFYRCRTGYRCTGGEMKHTIRMLCPIY